MSEAKPVFVVGCYRSGTTVLRRVLNSHPRVWLAKETQYLAFDEIGPGTWDAELDVAEIRHRVRSLGPALARMGWRQLPDPEVFLATHPRRTRATLYRWVCLSECPPDRVVRWWGDNTPRYVSMIPALHAAWPEARFVHVVRDPRDVAASVMKVDFGANTAAAAAAEWVERVGAGLVAERLVGARIHLVRFEDLLRTPSTVVSALADFLAIDDAFQPGEVGGDSGEVAGLPHLAKVAQPLDPSVIGAGRRELTSEQIATIERITQPFLGPLGYDLPVWRPSPLPNERLRADLLDAARGLATNAGRGVWRRLQRS